MNRKNKVLSMLIAVLIILSQVFYVSYAETTTETVVNYDENAYKMFVNLGILETGGSSGTMLDKGVTRGELSKILYRMMNLNDAATAGNIPLYSDVPTTHDEFVYVNTLSYMGIMKGYGDGSFGVDDPVTYSQAIKTIISVLGYKELSEAKGGYPTGYLVVASDLKLLNGISYDLDKDITQKIIAKLLSNATGIDVMAIKSIGDDIEYTTVKGKDFLTHYWKYTKIEGVLNANSSTHLNSSTSLRQNEVKIDDIVLETDEKTAYAEKLLGYYVKGYYKSDSDTGIDKLIFIRSLDNKNRSIKLDGEYVGRFDRTSGMLYYYNDGSDLNEKKITLSLVADVIYNGRFIAAYEPKMFTNVNGTLELIDSDADEVYDVVKIIDYKSLVIQSVNSINAPNYTIYNKYSPDIIIELDTEETDMRISVTDTNGAVVGIDTLSEWGVISAAISKDKKVINIVVSSDTVEGTISEVYETDGIQNVVINDTKYKLVKDYYTSIVSRKKLNVSDNNIFLLDKDNKIVAVKAGSTNETVQFGLFVKATRVDNSVQNQKVLILNSKDEMRTFAVASKVYINDKPAKDVTTVLKTRQVIRFSINSKDELAHIYTSFDTPDNTNRLFQSYNVPNLPYDNSTKSFNGNVMLGDETIVFVMPTEANQNDLKHYYAKSARQYFKDDGSTNYTLAGYNLNEDDVYPDVMLYVHDTTEVYLDRKSDVIIFDHWSAAIDEEDLTRRKLNGFAQGEKVSFYMEDLNPSSDEVIHYCTEKESRPFSNPIPLQPGDVVRVGMNEDNRVKKIELIYSLRTNNLIGSDDGLSGKNFWPALSQGYSNQNHLILGYAYETYDTLIGITPTESTLPILYTSFKDRDLRTEYFDYTRPALYLVEIEGKFGGPDKVTIEPSDIGEVITSKMRQSTSTRVLIYSYDRIPKEMYIIKDLRTN